MPCGCTPDSSYGRRIGSALGGYAGHAIGEMAKAKFARIMGSGDYTLEANSLFAGGGSMKSANVPTLVPGGSHGIRVQYREYLGEVRVNATTVGAFNIDTYRLQPGNSRTFPWVSTIAGQYEEYQFNGLVFHFKSTASDFSTAVNMGSVIMATQYDANDPIFANKQEMLMSAYSQESKTDDDGLHGVECAYFLTPNALKYVRTSFVDPTDVSEYDLGNFSIATQGSNAPVGSIIGSLYVYYDITFLKERLWGTLGRAMLYAGLSGSYTNGLNPFPAGSMRFDFGNAPLNTWQVTSLANRITLPTWTPRAVWMIKVQWQGTAAAAPWAEPTLDLQGCTLIRELSTPQNGDATAVTVGMYIVVQQTSDRDTAGTGPPRILFIAGANDLPITNAVYQINIMQVNNFYNTTQTQ